MFVDVDCISIEKIFDHTSVAILDCLKQGCYYYTLLFLLIGERKKGMKLSVCGCTAALGTGKSIKFIDQSSGISRLRLNNAIVKQKKEFVLGKHFSLKSSSPMKLINQAHSFILLAKNRSAKLGIIRTDRTGSISSNHRLIIDSSRQLVINS